MGPVIPAGRVDAIARELTKAGCPAKLAHADHQSRSQKAASIQVFQEGRETLIERRQQFLFEPAIVIEVSVPVGDRVVDPPAPVHGNQTDTRLDEPAGECVARSARAAGRTPLQY